MQGRERKREKRKRISQMAIEEGRKEANSTNASYSDTVPSLFPENWQPKGEEEKKKEHCMLFHPGDRENGKVNAEIKISPPPRKGRKGGKDSIRLSSFRLKKKRV